MSTQASTRASLVAALENIVGRRVLRDSDATRRFRTGFRYGGGNALAVVKPRSLLELWRVLEACVAARVIVIPQAANTGLTGGSTPAPEAAEGYDRDVIIVSLTQIAQIYPIEGGHQVICLPGATLHQLERVLEPLGREPHSLIGSSCLGASVIGGICNNSGGSLVRRGPAYTEMALFAQVDRRGGLELVNHLGVKLGQQPEDILERLDRGAFSAAEIEPCGNQRCSDHQYSQRVREIDSEIPTRFNADPRRLFEASGCAGRVVVFAVRLDTYPKDSATRVFYIGTNDTAELTSLRWDVLSGFRHLPVSGEYLHRDTFDIAAAYGKDTFLAIRHLGTRHLPLFFRLKAGLDGLWHGRTGPLSTPDQGSPCANRRSAPLSDRILQQLARYFPNHLPPRMRLYQERFQHHLLLKVADEGIAEAASHLARVFPSASGDFFECTPQEGQSAFLHRFAAAGAAVRYRTLHSDTVEDIVAVDVALRPNDRDWFETLPEALSQQVHRVLYYGHFFCHVFHQDYLLKRGCDPVAFEHALWRILDARGAQYPAEHNVGHLYRAKPELVSFYRGLDPTNSFNPGLGQTSRRFGWD